MRYTIRVSIPDAEGNVRTATEQFTIGTGSAPQFGAVSFTPAESDGKLPAGTTEVTLTVNYTDLEGDVDVATVTFNGKDVSADVSLSSQAVVFTTDGLESGSQYTFEVTITDAGAHSVTKTVSVNVAKSESSGGSSLGGSSSSSSGSSSSGGNSVSTSPTRRPHPLVHRPRQVRSQRTSL